MDIDIDVPSSFKITDEFQEAVRASIYKDGKLSPHPCGAYFQNVPVDPLSGLAAIPYSQIEELDAQKIDFLHVHVYDHFTSKDEIRALLQCEPDWNILQIPSIVDKLFQISKHYQLISRLKPTSILELADCLALIRPQKRYLVDLYIKNQDKARSMLYTQDEGTSYSFKKGHALSYAMVIVLQLHLIKCGIQV